MRLIALCLVVSLLASCSGIDRVADGTTDTTSTAAKAVTQAVTPTLVMPPVRLPMGRAVEYSLYSVQFQVRAPKPGGGTYVRGESTFFGFTGQKVRWLSASTTTTPTTSATPATSTTSTTPAAQTQGQAATGLFACVRLLGVSSDSPDSLRLGVDYASASLAPEDPEGGDAKAWTVKHSAGSLPDMLLSMGTKSSVAMGDGSWLDITVTRTMVNKGEAAKGMEAIRRKQTAMSAVQRRKEGAERDDIARALGAKNASCSL